MQLCEEIRITREETAVEQRDSKLDIRGIEAVALLQDATSWAHLQSQIPQTLRKASSPIFESPLGFVVGMKKKQIDIRMRKQPTAPESSQRDQAESLWPSFLRADDFPPETESDFFHQGSPLGNGCATISGGIKLLTDPR